MIVNSLPKAGLPRIKEAEHVVDIILTGPSTKPTPSEQRTWSKDSVAKVVTVGDALNVRNAWEAVEEGYRAGFEV